MVRRLVDYSDDDEHAAADDGTTKSTGHRVRFVAGCILLLAICHRIYFAERDIANSFGREESTVQLVELWLPHLFYMLAIIGTAVALNIIGGPDS